MSRADLETTYDSARAVGITAVKDETLRMTPLRCAAHGIECEAGAEQSALQIRPDNVIPELLCQLVRIDERWVAERARVVHEDVDPIELPNCLVHEPLAVVHARDVGADETHHTASGFDLARQVVAQVPPSSCTNDGGAASGELLRDHATESRRHPGDHRDLAGQHHVNLARRRHRV